MGKSLSADAQARKTRWRTAFPSLPEEAPEVLEDLVGEIARWNRQIKLTAPGTIEELARRLVDDSLTLAPFVKGRSILDIGTGPGIPALVLAAALPDVEVRSVEPISKKVAFTRAFLARHPALARRVRPFTGRAEGEADAPWGQADTVLSRAFRAPAEWIKVGAPLVLPNGRLLVTLGNETGAEADAMAEQHGLSYGGLWQGEVFGAPRGIRFYERLPAHATDVPRGTSN